jgi:hypothetical protein
MRHKVYLCDAKFLAVALSMRLLTKEEALTIFEEHRRYISRKLGRWGCGEVALELGLLTPVSIAAVLREQEKLRAVGHRLPDPVGGMIVRDSSITRLTMRSATLVALGVAVLFSLAGWYSGGDLQLLINLAALVAVVIALALAVLPTFLRIPLTFSGRLRWVTIPLAIGLAAYGWASAIELRTAVAGTSTALNSEVMNFIDSVRLVIILLFGLLIMSDLAGKWRHWQIFNYQMRTGLLRRLVSKVYQYTARLAQIETPEQLAQMDLYDLIGKTMARSAKIMLQDPWDRLSAALLVPFGKRAYGGLSLWYLEPSPNLEALIIRRFAAPSAPPSVIEQFKLVRAGHRPAVFKEDQFAFALAEALKAARGNGRTPREELMAIQGRSQFMSVAGYVYKKKKVLVARDASLCVAFDRSYREKADNNLTGIERRWLDFNSFACLPVLDTLGGEEPVFGVLVAFKNITGGFRREEWSLLASTAKLLGLLIRSHRAAEDRLVGVDPKREASVESSEQQPS